MELLPENLIDNKGNSIAKSSITGGVVGLYFSAHWCGPCRGFTPVLSKWYTDFTTAHPDKKLSIVFVSSDRTQEDFTKYHETMSFYALPFSERDLKGQISAKYGVRGIPTLVFLDGNGDTITKNGREIVSNDPTGAEYPWAPKKLEDIIPGPLLSHNGAADENSLKGKYVSFYFSAHWCPPCRTFTPKLAEIYKAVTGAGKPWEVVYVSADNDEDEFNEYYETMPWLALPHEDPRSAALNAYFEVEGIPTLVLVSPEGKVISTDLRSVLEDDTNTPADFPWPRKAVTSLSSGVGSINDEPMLVILTDGSDAQVAAANAALTPAADAELARGDAARLRFAVSGASSGDTSMRDRLLGLIGKTGGATFPLAILFVVPAGKRYDFGADEITAAGVSAVVERFGNKSLELIALR